jgi:hypothetical protein
VGINAKTEREAALWIEVDEENTSSKFSKSCPEADCCGGLSYSTLLVEDGDDLRLAMLCDGSREWEILGRSSEE